MFRVVDIPATGPIQISEGSGQVGPPPEGTIRWIDLEAQDEAQLQIVGQRFDFHPLAIEDCAHFDQRPKLEEYSGHLFIVVHGFVCPGTDPCESQAVEVHAFLGKGYLVTVHSDKIKQLDAVWQRIVGDPALGRRGADFIYHQLIDQIVDHNFIILDMLSDTLEEVEDSILEHAEIGSKQDLGRIFQLKRTLVLMRRTLSPQRDVFAMLSKRGSEVIQEKTTLYYRDVYDHLTRIYESIDAARDVLGNALEAYLSMVAQRTNEIMKRLTLVSAVFLPLAFITGFFGMNFQESMPFNKEWVMWIVVAGCVVVIPGTMLLWFWRSKWL